MEPYAARKACFLRELPAVLTVGLLLSCGLGARAQTSNSTFFLPQNPAAAAYVLGRLSDQELIDAPRSEFVYVALLQRKGLARKYRLEALDGLSQLRHSDRLTELLAGLSELDKKGDRSTNVIRELLPVLLDCTAAELASKRVTLEKLAFESRLPLTRQGGYAGLIAADGSLDRVWKSAASTQLPDVILAIPLLPEKSRQTSFYARLEPLLTPTNAAEIVQAAMAAIATVPGRQLDAFSRLAELVEARIQTKVAIASLQLIPQTAWDKDALERLAISLVEYLQKTSPAERTGEDFASTLRLASQLSAHLPKDQALAVSRALRELGPAVFVIRAVYEQMRFDRTLLAVEPRKPVAITLENNDAMPHNLAILLPGALEEIGLAAEKMTTEPDVEGRLYVPASPKVLHATKMVAPGQKLELAFTAPSEPGEYPFVCTFPGHWRRMTGILAVTNDVEAYLAQHADSQQVHLTEWKLEDLTSELSNPTTQWDLQTGADFFTKLACVQCHRLGKQGYAYGPDLTDVFQRYTNDRPSVLEQILEPSKVIADRYRVYEFQLKDGEPLLGMVLKEDTQSITVQTGPADSLIQTLKNADVVRRQAQKSSPMPLGLLNALSKEQILDLLAYIESGGKFEGHHQHSPAHTSP